MMEMGGLERTEQLRNLVSNSEHDLYWKEFISRTGWTHHYELQIRAKMGVADQVRATVYYRLSGAHNHRRRFRETYFHDLRNSAFSFEQNRSNIVEQITTAMQGEEVSPSLIVLVATLYQHFPNIDLGFEFISFMCLFDNIFSDVQACFWTLVALLEDSLPDYYITGSLHAQVDAFVLENLLDDIDGELSAGIHNFKGSLRSLYSHWFTTLYSCLSSPIALRIWDVVMADLSQARINLYRFALALLLLHRDELLRVGESDVDQQDGSSAIAPVICSIHSSDLCIQELIGVACLSMGTTTMDDLEILWEKQRQLLEQLCDKRQRMDATITQTVHCTESFLRVFVERLSFVFELMSGVVTEYDDEALQTMTCLHSCVVSVGRRLRQTTIDDERVEGLATSLEAAFWMAVASAYHCLRLAAHHRNRHIQHKRSLDGLELFCFAAEELFSQSRSLRRLKPSNIVSHVSGLSPGEVLAQLKAQLNSMRSGIRSLLVDDDEWKYISSRSSMQFSSTPKVSTSLVASSQTDIAVAR